MTGSKNKEVLDWKAQLNMLSPWKEASNRWSDSDDDEVDEILETKQLIKGAVEGIKETKLGEGKEKEVVKTKEAATDVHQEGALNEASKFGPVRWGEAREPIVVTKSEVPCNRGRKWEVENWRNPGASDAGNVESKEATKQGEFKKEDPLAEEATEKSTTETTKESTASPEFYFSKEEAEHNATTADKDHLLEIVNIMVAKHSDKRTDSVSGEEEPAAYISTDPISPVTTEGTSGTSEVYYTSEETQGDSSDEDRNHLESLIGNMKTKFIGEVAIKRAFNNNSTQRPVEEQSERIPANDYLQGLLQKAIGDFNERKEGEQELHKSQANINTNPGEKDITEATKITTTTTSRDIIEKLVSEFPGPNTIRRAQTKSISWNFSQTPPPDDTEEKSFAAMVPDVSGLLNNTILIDDDDILTTQGTPRFRMRTMSVCSHHLVTWTASGEETEEDDRQPHQRLTDSRRRRFRRKGNKRRRHESETRETATGVPLPKTKNSSAMEDDVETGDDDHFAPLTDAESWSLLRTKLLTHWTFS